MDEHQDMSNDQNKVEEKTQKRTVVGINKKTPKISILLVDPNQYCQPPDTPKFGLNNNSTHGVLLNYSKRDISPFKPQNGKTYNYESSDLKEKLIFDFIVYYELIRLYNQSKLLNTRWNYITKFGLNITKQIKKYRTIEKPEATNKIKKYAFGCKHANRELYAKGKCDYCYHKALRTKKSTECPHNNKKAFCRKMCDACYNN